MSGFMPASGGNEEMLDSTYQICKNINSKLMEVKS